MISQARFAEVASLVGDPARASMLHALLDGRALTASELARVAGVMPQTASGHLARLAEAGLLSMMKQGRHRFHRLASSSVADMMESIMRVAADAAPTGRRLRIGPKDAALRVVRTCYDHLAGTLAVALADAMIAKGFVELGDDAGVVTDDGRAFLDDLGFDDLAGSSRRVFCRPCLDWSVRRPHLAGRVGAALRHQSFERDWIRRIDDSRAVTVTPRGQQAFREHFGVRLDDLHAGIEG
ncbi:MAG: ArsR/SmtB family transcription factor [Geminicoccaceae bacterium]